MFYYDENFKAVSLPYGSQYYKAMIILPDTRVSIDGFCAGFGVEAWNSIISGLTHEPRLEIGLPE